jgi:hypothetical protein
VLDEVVTLLVEYGDLGSRRDEPSG